MLTSLEACVDTVTTMVVIVGVALLCTLASIFTLMQVYGEGVHLISVTSSLINKTLSESPELLPDGFAFTVDDMMNKVYLHGRNYTVNVIRGISGEADDEKVLLMEKQVLELWDHIYHEWIKSNNTYTPHIKAPPKLGKVDWSTMTDLYQSSPELLNVSSLVGIMGENVEFLMSILNSVWMIARTNLTLAASGFTTLLSVLVGSSSVLFNSFINLIIFLSALFYLLSSSGKIYKPVEFLASLTPGSSIKWGLAFEDAVNSVFLASFKMAIFYGMWTWLIHNLFGVQFVFIPSALAAMLAMGT